MYRALVLLAFVATTVSAQRLHLPDEALLLGGLDMMYQQEYRRADSVFVEYVRRHPESPAGHLLRAGLIQYRCADADELVGGTLFDSLVVRSLALAGTMDRTPEAAPWIDFFKGTGSGLKAFLESERENWIDALRRGLEANRFYESCLAEDPTFADALLGTGSFAYWRSRKTSLLNWLPFVGDRRDEGIRSVMQCAGAGVLNQAAAIRGLVEMFLDAGRFADAAVWCDSGSIRYPGNRYFAWRKGVALFRAGNMTAARPAIEQDLRLLSTYERPNSYAEVSSRMNLAAALLALGNITEAVLQWNLVLGAGQSKFPAHLADRAKRKFVDAARLHSTYAPVLKNSK